MPIPPKPRTYVCPACGWKKITTPFSDVLREGSDWFSKCPQCSHEPLATRKPTLLELAVARLLGSMR